MIERFNPEDIAEEISEQAKCGKLELPVLPAIVQEIQAAIEDPNISVDNLVTIVEQDAIVCIRLVYTANSSLYMRRQKVRTTREAVARIGFKETRNVVTMVLSKNLYRTKSREYMQWMEALWAHSLASAYGARFLVDYLRFADPEKYFLMGLVHDIGKVLIIKCLSENEDWVKNLSHSQVEKILQIAHNGLGGVILRHWKFPKEFFEVATSHEGPKFFNTTSRGVLVVHLASRIASSIGYGYRKDFIGQIHHDSAKRLGINFSTISSISEKIKAVMMDSAGAL